MRAVVVAVAVLVAGCSLIPGLGGDDAAVDRLQRIAIIPFAYAGPDGGRACDLCPEPVVMRDTSKEKAVLATAFFFEQITQYPRFVVSDPRRVNALASVSMQDGLELFQTLDDIDVVVVGALIELRERQGSALGPLRPAGAAVYAALLDARTGEKLWSGTFDEDEKKNGRIRVTYNRLVNGGDKRWADALEYLQVGARKLIKSMAKSVAAS